MRILTGKFRGRVIHPPAGKHFRPTSGKSREGYFSHVGERVMDSAFLDLFAGSGIMGWEALSRGAASVTLVEKDTTLIKFLYRTREDLQSDAEIIRGDVMSVLKRMFEINRAFDLVYADPPYGFREYTELADACIRIAPHGMVAIEALKPHPLRERAHRVLSYGKTEIAILRVRGSRV